MSPKSTNTIYENQMKIGNILEKRGIVIDPQL
jgi:hypothetical protein